MIPVIRIPDRAPPPGRHRRFRMMIAGLLIIVEVAIALQFSSHALLPAEKTNSLWGVLTGIVVMTVLIELIWARAARKSRRA